MSSRRPSPPTVGIVGLGHVGLPTGLAFARKRFEVVGYDASPALLRQIARGGQPYREAGLDRLLTEELRSGRFRVASSLRELVSAAEVIFLCAPTPSLRGGRVDLGAIRRASAQVGHALRGSAGFRVVVVKSTVPPGTTDTVVTPIVRRRAGLSERSVGFASNPEFLAEGTMVRDSLSPERVVVGARDARTWRVLKRLFAPFHAPLLRLTPSGAELAKYSANTLLALKVSFANEIARLADLLDIDVDQVMAAVGSDSRLGPSFLKAGPGFGGSCFDKDLRGIAAWARERGVSLRVPETALAINEEQVEYCLRLVRRATGSLRGRRIALLGLAFKAGTEDVRGSRAFPIAMGLVRAGASVRAHDPVASEEFLRRWRSAPVPGSRRLRVFRSTEEALRGADTAVLQADWPEYARWPARWSRGMRSPRLVDLRRAIPPRVAARAGLEVVALGAPSQPRNVTAGGAR